jgi:hypothetical protein
MHNNVDTILIAPAYASFFPYTCANCVMEDATGVITAKNVTRRI